ncbi:hypothetical protein [Bacillus sp. FJAT-26390]|uniref:hypothetical protein n=1 Tax=Bacillus sp. FJAT-26390 TaxID=1743142 RepID=UPI000807BAB9|nr:hypothetical protein [Bacillus sp. FJAT-26390]OBZ13599.1 hypothetical protein A7975_12315 [Bacillus sp. FJAT-26390]
MAGTIPKSTSVNTAIGKAVVTAAKAQAPAPPAPKPPAPPAPKPPAPPAPKPPAPPAPKPPAPPAPKPPVVTSTPQTTATANQQILKAKEEYQAALDKGDRAAMEAARKKADALRQQGGTIGADQTLEQARVIVSTPTTKPTTSSPSTTYNSQGQKNTGTPSQQSLNASLEQAKKDWWDAKFKGDQKGMENAAQLGGQLRSQGAQETDAIRQLDAANTAKLQSAAQNAKDKDLDAVKQLWWEARLKDDQKGMDAAALKGDELRSKGAKETDASKQLDIEYAAKLKIIQENKKQLEQKKLNEQLATVKEKWWIARLNDNTAGVDSATADGKALRDKGALETEQSRAIDDRYGVLLQEKVSNESKLLDEKKKWWDAKLNLDALGMDNAKRAADNLRGKAYVNDHTKAMVDLEQQNLNFLNAKVSYYKNVMDLNAAGKQADLHAMNEAASKGASLKAGISYKMDEANNNIIEFRKEYWRERADYDSNAYQESGKENTYRNQFGTLSSLLITGDKYNFDNVANDIIYKTSVKWSSYAGYTQKEMSNHTANDSAIQNNIRQMNSAMGTVFTKTKLDVVNEQIIDLRKQYWNAVDQYKDSGAFESRINKMLKDYGNMDGVLKKSKQETINREYKANRDALNNSLTTGNHEQSIHYIRALQQMTEQSGSDLSIRRSGAVLQQSVDQLMVHIKSQEWDNLVNLRSDEGSRLAKAKTAVRNNLLADIDSAAIKELDRTNFVIISAKKDYWQAAANLSTASMEQARSTLSNAANSKYASLSASLDTAYDRLYREGLEISLMEWSNKGNASKDSEVSNKREALTRSLNYASSLTNNMMGAIGQSFSVNRLDAGTTLDRTLNTVYQNKVAQWQNIARYGTEIEPLNTSIASNMRSIQSVLDTVNIQIGKDLTLPAFALDQANDRLLKDRNGILKAIESGDRDQANALFNQGLSRGSEGASLKIWELVPNLSTVNWNRQSELEAMNFKIDYTIEYVNKQFTEKEISTLQSNLAKMKIYEGPITGKYDKQTYVAVYGYHKLLESDARAVKWKNDGYDLGKDGSVTKELLNFATSDAGLGRTNKYKIDSENLAKAVTVFGIGDGMVSQLAADGVEFLNEAVQISPMNPSFWTKTLPEAWSLAKGIVTGEITAKGLFGNLADSLKQEFVEPFTYIKNHQNVLNGDASYEDARQFGKNLMKAIEVVAAAVSLGAAGVAKLASKMPKLVEGIRDIATTSHGKLDELESKVVRGTGNGHPNGTPSPTHNAKGERLDNVEVPKVKRPTGYDDFIMQENKAIEMYKGFIAIKTDIGQIAKNTGWKEADIQQIKNHLFINSHKFDNGEVRKFDPDYQQALAWKRLNDGNYNKYDILLLNHELFESNYMKKNSITYEKAHKEANMHYNWDMAIHE